jgi:hypothetical protein
MTATSKLPHHPASEKHGHLRFNASLKLVFISLLVLLTCNSLFWFPLLLLYQPQPKLTASSNTSNFMGKDNENAKSVLPTVRNKATKEIIKFKENVSNATATALLYTDDSQETTTPSDSQPKEDDSSTSSSSNRTLVILSGNLRCGERAWESLYSNLLDVNSADLALIGVNDDTERYPNASLVQRAKYVWTTPEYDEWADALDLINGTSWRTRVLPQISNYSLDKGLLGGIFNTPSSGAIQGMMKWWLSEYVRKDPTIGTTYDTFVLTRTDQYYACPLDLQTELRRRTDVSIPRGEDYSGICDRFMVICDVDKLLEALDVLPPFLNDYDPKVYGKLHNPEGLLKATFSRKKLQVQRISRVMFTCASMDGRDPTRWRKISISNTDALRQFGVDFKYDQEYARARIHCARHANDLYLSL